MKDRVTLINAMTEPECGEKINDIVCNHYHKFNFIYDLVSYIMSNDYNIDHVQSYNVSDTKLNVDIVLTDEGNNDIELLRSLIDNYINEYPDTKLIVVESVTSPGVINISIKASFKERDEFDYEDGFNSH